MYVVRILIIFYACNFSFQSYYQPYAGLQQEAQLQQYAILGGGGAAAARATAPAGLTMAAAANPSALYPYFQYAPASAVAAGGYSMVQYPQLYQYAAAAAVGATTGATTLAAVAGGLQQYGGAVAFTPNSIAQAGIALFSTTDFLLFFLSSISISYLVLLCDIYYMYKITTSLAFLCQVKLSN